MRTCSQMVLGYSRDNIAANRKLHSIMILIVNFKDFWHIIESVNYVAATQKKSGSVNYTYYILLYADIIDVNNIITSRTHNGNDSNANFQHTHNYAQLILLTPENFSNWRCSQTM